MAGRPDYQTLAATLPSEALASFSEIPTTTVAAGTNEQYTFYSPAATKSRIVSAYLNAPAPAGATAGSHTIAVSIGAYSLTQGNSNHTDQVTYQNGYWPSATGTQQPTSGYSDQAYWLQVAQFDSVTGLQVTYTNDTTGGTTAAGGARAYEFLVVEEDLP